MSTETKTDLDRDDEKQQSSSEVEKKGFDFVKNAYDSMCRTNYFFKMGEVPQKLRRIVFDRVFTTVRNSDELGENGSLKLGEEGTLCQLVHILQIVLTAVFLLLSNNTFFMLNQRSNLFMTCVDWDTEETKNAVREAIQRILSEVLQANLDPSLLTPISAAVYNVLDQLVRIPKFFMTSELRDEQILKETYDCRFMSDIEKWHIRIRIRDLLLSNYTVSAITELLHVAKGTVISVNKMLKMNPNLQLIDLKIKQKGPKADPFLKISDSIYNELVRVLLEELPSKYCLNFSSWTGEAIQLYLKVVHAIEVKLSYVYYFLARMSITSKFAKRRCPLQDRVKRDAFLNHGFFQAVLQTLREGRIMLFQDETSLQRGEHKRGYAPRGQRATLSHTPSAMRTGASYSIFTSFMGHLQAFLTEGTYNARLFIQDLKKIHQLYPDKLFTICLDNCRIHTAAAVMEWVNKFTNENGQQIFKFVFLPPYCPDLNPVEYLNNDLKNALRKTNSLNKAQVINDAEAFMDRLSDDKYKKEKLQSYALGEGVSWLWLNYLDAVAAYKKERAAA